jgi:hypothetical protein
MGQQRLQLRIGYVPEGSRLTVTGFAGQNKRGRSMFSCVCSCGNHVVVQGTDLKRGAVRSCGCLARETSAATGKATATHGQSHKTAEYAAWEAMLSRTGNPNNPAYKNYGGRGIRVCRRWRTSFENFFADMGKRPSSSHTLQRVLNDEGYKKSNCTWATWHEQARNRRSTKLTQAKADKIRLQYAAGGITGRALAMEYGVDPSTISNIVTGDTWAYPPKKPSSSVAAPQERSKAV